MTRLSSSDHRIPQTRPSFLYPRIRWISALAASLLPALSLSAATIVWDGETSSDFTLNTNWSGDTMLANNVTSDIASFSSSAVAYQPMLSGDYSVRGMTMAGGTQFTGSGTLTLGSSGLTASGANTIGITQIKLGANATLSLAGGVSGSGTTLTSTIDTSGFNLNLTRTGTGALDLTSAEIRGSGGTVTFAAGSGSNQILAGGSYTFTGAVAIVQANYTFTTLANGGTASSFGAGTADVTLANSNSFMALTNIGAGGSTDRLFKAGPSGNVVISNNGTGALHFRNTGTYGSLAISFRGTFTGGVNTWAQLITGAATVSKSEASLWALTGANTYAGSTTISGGSLFVDGSIRGTSGVSVTSATLGGNGTIAPGGSGGITVAASGRISPGMPETNGGLGTLTIDSGENTAASVLSLSSGAKFVFQLGAEFTSDRVALINAATGDLVFNNNTIDFSDLTGGLLGIGSYPLFTADTAGAFSGLTTAADGTIAGGLAIGSGLNAYPGSSLQLVDQQIVLNVIPEPNTAGSLIGGALMLLGLQRFRRLAAFRGR